MRHPVRNSPNEFVRLSLELEELDASEQRIVERRTEIYARFSQLMVEAGISGLPKKSDASRSPLPKHARGQGDRIVDLIKENPEADFGWLTAEIYGSDSSENRQTLGSMIAYLTNRKKVLKRVGRGKYIAI
jgi:hypothetical protein